MEGRGGRRERKGRSAGTEGDGKGRRITAGQMYTVHSF